MRILCPDFATACNFTMLTKGRYAKGWPLGAVVHFTAGHDGAENAMRYGAGQGYVFWCIQRDGRLFCAHPADRWGSHAGHSKWPKLFREVSDDLMGIEMNAAGRLTKVGDAFYPWWAFDKGKLKPGAKPIPKDEVRYTPGRDNQQKGHYHAYTAAQEATLIRTILWLKAQRPDIFRLPKVLGHDEVSGVKGLGWFRKNDPGAALSMTMTEFRAELERRWEARRSA